MLQGLSIITLFIPVLLLAFWAWMLHDFLQHPPFDPRERQLWLLAFVFLNVLTAAYYYFMIYRERDHF